MKKRGSNNMARFMEVILVQEEALVFKTMHQSRLSVPANPDKHQMIGE